MNDMKEAIGKDVVEDLKALSTEVLMGIATILTNHKCTALEGLGVSMVFQNMLSGYLLQLIEKQMDTEMEVSNVVKSFESFFESFIKERAEEIHEEAKKN